MKLRKVENDNDDLRGMFFIVKGHYEKGVAPSVISKVTGGEVFLGGYDPSGEDTAEWYMALDKVTYHCICCSGDFEMIKRGIVNAIKRYKTKENYLMQLKMRGEYEDVSKPMRFVYDMVYAYYGNYYSEVVANLEEEAYSLSHTTTPVKKSLKKSAPKSLKKIKQPDQPKKIPESKPEEHKPVHHQIRNQIKPHKIKKLSHKNTTPDILYV